MTIAHSTQSVFSQQQNENWLPPDNPQLLLLRNWQIQRLSHTYAEFKASSRYNLAADFFLNDIYSPIGFSDRHHEIDHIYNLMRRILPEKMLKAIAATVELYNLTEEVDQKLVRILIDKVGMTNILTVDMYATGYRACDNYVERVRQLDLIVKAGVGVEGITNIPLVATTIRISRIPARLAGWADIHGFLERGLEAFRRAKDSRPFFESIHEHEMQALDNMFSSKPDPFGFGLDETLVFAISDFC